MQKTTLPNLPGLRPMTDKTDPWAIGHNTAVSDPMGPEHAILSLTKAALHAARLCRMRDDDTVTPDYYGAENVAAPIIQGARAALDYDLGRLDGGTLDSYLADCARACGLNPDTYEVA